MEATTGADVMRLGLTKPSKREREIKKIRITFLYILPYSNVPLFQRNLQLATFQKGHNKKKNLSIQLMYLGKSLTLYINLSRTKILSPVPGE